MELDQLVVDFANGLEQADAKRPVAVNQRSKEQFQPGIGPHTEAAAVALIAEEMHRLEPERYCSSLAVQYPSSRRKCDICFGIAPEWTWAVEVKLLRFVGDNGQPNDNMLMHLLSPYAAHRSAVTDCTKLVDSGLQGRKAILIYGFEHSDWPLEPALQAFESLAKLQVQLGPRFQHPFSGLIHPVHSKGTVCAWEIQARG